MDDPFGLVQADAGELTDSHRIAAEQSLHKLAQGVTVVTTTVDHAGRETVVTKQLPPNVVAVQSILTGLAPQRWQTPDVPRLAVQYVVNLPPVSADAQSWLRDIGRAAPDSAVATISTPPVLPYRVGTALPAGADPGGLVPTASGPVPDPLVVPNAHFLCPPQKNTKKRD
jgi:hypothetical protein